VNEAKDKYPSRANGKACLIPRADPVVYAHASAGLQQHISTEQVARYERDGFLVLQEVFSAEEVGCFKEELERLRNDPMLRGGDGVITEPGSGDVRSIFSVHTVSPVFKRLAGDARLAGIAQGLLDDEVYIHQSRLNYKPGFRGKEFYWHSDFETWHVEDGMPSMRALSMSITLTENTPYNGALMLIPGSHKSYAVCSGETPDDHSKASLKKQEYGVPDDGILTLLRERHGLAGAVAKPGSVIIFDCNVMHGSNSNITPDPRSNVFFVYNALSNRVVAPFCNKPPRPEFICSREQVECVYPQAASLESYQREFSGTK